MSDFPKCKNILSNFPDVRIVLANARNVRISVSNSPKSEHSSEEFVKQHGIEIAPHPPYSPDLAPSDFYLFGALKSRMSGTKFTSSDEIVEWITEQFEAIPPQELERVFQNWQARLLQCSQSDGSYL